MLLSRRHVLSLFAGGAALAIGGPSALAEHARILRLIDKAHALPSVGARIDFISRALLGTPYRGYTLIGGPRKPEKFVARDDAFDCVTYVEAVLAAAMVQSPDAYQPMLKQIRYRDGEVAWHERNHYFSQWCDNNVANQRCKPVVVPGVATVDKTLNFMPALGARRVSLHAVPRADLIDNKQLLATGDIIAFLSQRPKLDYFHVGFVVVAPDGGLWLRHAAKSRRRVVDEPLLRFLATNRVKAVTLLRPQEPEDAVALI
ncbi:MAG: DUF1460 domain-containing protein [Pseudolabrys sp.]|nr:DUF1460 domain-containing protein [Pseudolabrys sp.]